MEMKNPPPMMTEKMPTTKPPTRSAAVSRVSSQGASALIEHPVEDYASVILRSASGILGTVEVGNGFPRDGTDGEWKIAGRDAILTMKDGIMKLATSDRLSEAAAWFDPTLLMLWTVRDSLP